MNDQSSQNQNDEIDLSVLFNKIRSFFKSLLVGVVMIFQFFWKHKIRLLILLIIGVGLQLLLLTQTKKIYSSEYLLRTNFESTEYLYSKVKSINGKLESKDTLFLKRVFGENYKRVEELEVEPVVNIYHLVNKSEENKEIFELLLDEYGDISFLEEEINVNEYPSHKIRIYIKGEDNNEFISGNLYNFLSNNQFYDNLKQIALESYEEQLDQNQAIRIQIDSIIKDQRGNSGMLPKSDNNSISFKGSENFNDILRLKRELLYTDLNLRNMVSSNNEVLKIIDSSFGVLDKERTKYFFFIPLTFILIYCLVFFITFLSNRIIRFVNE